MKRAKRRKTRRPPARGIAVEFAAHDADFLRIARGVMKKHDRVLRALASEVDQLPQDDADARWHLASK